MLPEIICNKLLDKNINKVENNCIFTGFDDSDGSGDEVLNSLYKFGLNKIVVEKIRNLLLF